MKRLALLALLVACGGNDDGNTTDDDTTDTGSGGCTSHPNIPEEFACLWAATEDGCTTSGGAPANQVYYIMDGEVDADGHFLGEERFYWFFPMPGFDDDCIDVQTVEGDVFRTDPALVGCETCEEFYQVRRTVTENNCAMGYNNLFREDREGFYQLLMFDTLNSSGEPNEDNKVLVMHQEETRNGGLQTKEYARGNIEPLTETHGSPARFTWTSGKCMGR